jgi:hypothetical protein
MSCWSGTADYVLRRKDSKNRPSLDARMTRSIVGQGHRLIFLAPVVSNTQWRMSALPIRSVVSEYDYSILDSVPDFRIPIPQ